jgi:hypothetical protein
MLWRILFSIKIGSSIGMILGGLGQYLFPDSIAIIGSVSSTSIEHRELIGILTFFVGMILFYMPTDIKNSD